MRYKIKTTMRPDLELVVDEAENADLQRQGLLVSTTAVSDDTELLDERQAAARSTGKGKA